MEVTGACQCGKITFKANARSGEAELCHCAMCRRAVGNIHMTSLAARKDAVSWSGRPKTYASSPIAKRAFCGDCGTPLFFAYNDSEFMDLMVGAIDQTEALRPGSHFGVESRLEAFRRLDGLREERTSDNDRIVSLWIDATGHPPT